MGQPLFCMIKSILQKCGVTEYNKDKQNKNAVRGIVAKVYNHHS